MKLVNLTQIWQAKLKVKLLFGNHSISILLNKRFPTQLGCQYIIWGSCL